MRIETKKREHVANTKVAELQRTTRCPRTQNLRIRNFIKIRNLRTWRILQNATVSGKYGNVENATVRPSSLIRLVTTAGRLSGNYNSRVVINLRSRVTRDNARINGLGFTLLHAVELITFDMSASHAFAAWNAIKRHAWLAVVEVSIERGDGIVASFVRWFQRSSVTIHHRHRPMRLLYKHEGAILENLLLIVLAVLLYVSEWRDSNRWNYLRSTGVLCMLLK